MVVRAPRASLVVAVGALLASAVSFGTGSSSVAAETAIQAGGVLRISVPDAVGGKTVVGQLAVAGATKPGFVTAYGCDDGLPRDADGAVTKADLNYDGRISRVWSNRLIVQADNDGDVCFYTWTAVDLVVDVNGVSFDTGISSFPNQRTDTRIESDGTDVATPEAFGSGGTNAGRLIAGGSDFRVSVPQAVGSKTVIGQLAVDQAQTGGFVTAYGCDEGIPRNAAGEITKADLNFNGAVSSVWSNRLIAQADDDGDLCFYASASVNLIVDINGVADAGITSFANQRTDTRLRDPAEVLIAPGQELRISVPEAAGGKTVIGQLAVDHAADEGFVTAYGCQDGLPNNDGAVSKADLNYDGRVTSVWSNRLIVRADAAGDICFFTPRAVSMIIDVTAVSTAAGIFSFPNQRTDTRLGTLTPITSIPTDSNGVPLWPQYTVRPALSGVSALTGEVVSASIAARPIVAVKIDNYRRARPQFGLSDADAVIEENAEGVTRFIALFHTRYPQVVGPVRSARTGDLDMLASMNRPVFAFSGANPGVTNWIASAERSGVLVDFSAQRRGCYRRESSRPSPHNLLLDPACAVGAARDEGAAQPLWNIDSEWTTSASVSTRDTTFVVPMDGVHIEWTWNTATRTYRRSQDGSAHVDNSGTRIIANNVVELRITHIPSPVDARSPHPITVGGGEAIVHRDGRAIPGTWSRATPYDPFTFFDSQGAQIPLDLGRTFIELERG